MNTSKMMQSQRPFSLNPEKKESDPLFDGISYFDEANLLQSRIQSKSNNRKGKSSTEEEREGEMAKKGKNNPLKESYADFGVLDGLDMISKSKVRKPH